MNRFKFRLQWLLIAITLLSSALVQAGVSLRAQTHVKGTDDKTCAAYLHGPEIEEGATDNAKALPLIFAISGTGIYSARRMVEIHPVTKALLDQKKVMVLSVEKPGISYLSAATPGHLIDDAVYNRHTQRDLIQCAIEALKWAQTTDFSLPTTPVYFVVHSEGTQVSLRVLKDLLTSDATTAARIKGIFASALVLQGWRDLINQQIGDATERAKFWKAYQNRDDKTLRNYGHLAYAYWHDILATEANEENLKALARTDVKTFLHVYHGLNDLNTRAKPVMDFESWNSGRRDKLLPAWLLSARYYQAGHALNQSAVDDMVAAILAELETRETLGLL